MRLVVVALLVLTGCGRIGFDGSADGEALGPDGGIDGSAAAAAGCWGAWLSGAPVVTAPARIEELVMGSARLSNPSLSEDGLHLWFETNANAGDILTATRPAADLPWTGVQSIAELNSAVEEGRLSMAPDRLTAVFVQGSPTQLVETSRASVTATFAAPSSSPFAALAGPGAKYDPELVRSGLRIYFSEGSEIYVADRATLTAPFAAPQRVATGGVSVADPALSPDERVMVFSDTRTSMRDLYFSVRASASEPFGPPMEVPGVNSASDEGDADLSSDGCELLFSSNRAGRNLFSVRVSN